MMAKFVHLFVSFVIISLAKIGCTLTQDDDKWSQQFLEMKVMITTLGTKISSLESRMSDLKIIEFASTVINMDSEAKTVNNRLDNMQNQLDIIKNAVVKIPSSATCPESIPSGRNPPDKDESSLVKVPDSMQENIIKKIDEYGRKLIKTHQDLHQSGEQQRMALDTLLNTARNGFTKVLDKVEIALTMEPQMTRVMQTVTGLTPKLSQMFDQLSDVSNDLDRMKTDMSTNGQKLSNYSRELTVLAESKAKLPLPLAPLRHIMEIATKMNVEFTALNRLESKIVKATELAQKLQTDQKQTGAAVFTIGNLTSTLDVIEKISLPLLFSLPYNFNNVQALLKDAIASMDNQTTCSYNEDIRLEMSRLKDSIHQVSSSHNRFSDGPFQETRDKLLTIQYETGTENRGILEKLSFARNAITQVQTNLKQQLQNCNFNKTSGANLVLG